MEYYLAMRKNEIMPFVVTWMELEGIMLSEISQSEKDRYRMFSLIMWVLRNLTGDHRGREEEKNSYKQRGREANHKRPLNTENKLRANGGGGKGERKMGDGH